MVAEESAGRQVPMAFLERIKDDFVSKYGGGKAATAPANGLNKEFGYSILITCLVLYFGNFWCMPTSTYSYLQSKIEGPHAVLCGSSRGDKQTC